MNAVSALAPGLSDAVSETQWAFRQLLDALARPGQVRMIGAALPGVALGGAMSRLLLCLCDHETPVWWQNRHSPLVQWLRFHTGAPVTDSPAQSSFAVLNDIQQAPALAEFASSPVGAPEFASTLLIELPALMGGPLLNWRGPGITSLQHVGLRGLPGDFWRHRQDSLSSFPRGVDIVFTCGENIMALPRTAQVGRLEGL